MAFATNTAAVLHVRFNFVSSSKCSRARFTTSNIATIPKRNALGIRMMAEPAGEAEAESEEEEVSAVQQQGPAMVKPEAGSSDINLSGVNLEFMRAGYAGDFERISSLIDKVVEEGDINCGDVNRRCVLQFAAAHGLKQQVEQLVAAGADIDAQDLGGYTALHLATGYERLETVKTLIQLGADANKVTFDSYGKLPVEIAEELLENARLTERKIFGISVGDGQARIKMRAELVQILEDATEEEDDEEEAIAEVDDGSTVVIRKREKVPEPDAPAPSAGENVDDGSTVVIRKKEKKIPTPAAAAATAPCAADADANITAVPASPAAKEAEDVKVTIRVRGETLEK